MTKKIAVLLLLILPSVANARICYHDSECDTGQFCVFWRGSYDTKSEHGACCDENDADCIVSTSEGNFYTVLMVDETTDPDQWCYSGNCGDTSCLKTYKVQYFGTEEELQESGTDAFNECQSLFKPNNYAYTEQPELEECMAASTTLNGITTRTYCLDPDAVQDMGNICLYMVDAGEPGWTVSEEEWQPDSGSATARFFRRSGVIKLGSYGYSCEISDIQKEYTCGAGYWYNGTQCNKCPSLQSSAGNEIFGTTDDIYNSEITGCMQKPYVDFLDEGGIYHFETYNCFYTTDK